MKLIFEIARITFWGNFGRNTERDIHRINNCINVMSINGKSERLSRRDPRIHKSKKIG